MLSGANGGLSESNVSHFSRNSLSTSKEVSEPRSVVVLRSDKEQHDEQRSDEQRFIIIDSLSRLLRDEQRRIIIALSD